MSTLEQAANLPWRALIKAGFLSSTINLHSGAFCNTIDCFQNCTSVWEILKVCKSEMGYVSLYFELFDLVSDLEKNWGHVIRTGLTINKVATGRYLPPIVRVNKLLYIMPALDLKVRRTCIFSVEFVSGQ
jgi:hypothetical protein